MRAPRVLAVAARVAATTLVIAAGLALAGDRASAATATVVITTTLQPRDLQVAPGPTVEFRNDDGERHRPRSVDGPEDFDVDLEPGASATVLFDAVGAYRYVDDRDRDDEAYWGSITVTSSPSTTAPPSGGGGGAPAP